MRVAVLVMRLCGPLCTMRLFANFDTAVFCTLAVLEQTYSAVKHSYFVEVVGSTSVKMYARWSGPPVLKCMVTTSHNDSFEFHLTCKLEHEHILVVLSEVTVSDFSVFSNSQALALDKFPLGNSFFILPGFTLLDNRSMLA